MLLYLIRFLRGYVSFTVCGRYPERFINISSRNSIRVWDVARHGESFGAAMYMSDYRRVRPLAKSAGVRLCIKKRYGLPAIAVRWRGRAGVFVGAFAFILTVFIMSQFIWCIDITGIETLSESETKDMLRSNGLYIGAFKPSVDFQGVSRAMMIENRKIGWMAVNVTGSCASVEIKEESAAPEVVDVREPCNVKASRDGTILRIHAGEGDTLLKEGSGVIEGQLVVSGVMDDMTGGTRLVHAQAEVIASTVYSAEFTVPESRELILPAGEKGERKALSIYGLRIPLKASSAGGGLLSVNDREDNVDILDTALPLGIITESVAAMEKKEVKLNDSSAEELLLKQAYLYEVFTLVKCTVTDRDYMFSYADGSYKLSVTYSCEEDIAVQTPIGTDEGTQRLRPLEDDR